MNKPKRFVKREWLNPPSSYNDGWIKYGVELEKVGGRWGIYSDLMIADCSRTITLDLYVSNSREYNQVIKKIGKLRTALDILEEKITEAYEWKEQQGKEEK